ncbi:Hypothetical_protein [Hexamita inflata]|uniref:Hypothetical_protein n=1 Tax=Hexamita inflata TaxID=28002 RepID=A0AA86P7Y9_9EUKA|nr:Hypothetical protein HINF_LOCUS21417 [Hexamita inflata]
MNFKVNLQEISDFCLGIRIQDIVLLCSIAGKQFVKNLKGAAAYIKNRTRSGRIHVEQSAPSAVFRIRQLQAYIQMRVEETMFMYCEYYLNDIFVQINTLADS